MPTSSATKAGIKVLADIVMKDSMRLRCSERCYFKALIWQVRSFTTWSLGETQQEQVDYFKYPSKFPFWKGSFKKII